jgi:hypothetical protein
MNRLQKFVEGSSNGKQSGRTAYAFGPDNLPEPTPDSSGRLFLSIQATSF